MKTTKIISAISLVLILAANSLLASSTTISDPGTTVKQQSVMYVVKVNCPPNFPIANDNFIIIITDEKGRKVAPAQAFHEGVWAYTFREAGSFRGVRIASMVSYPATPTEWVIPPVKIIATFYAGQTYFFELIPESNETGIASGE